jgi:alpha-galactosidase
MCKLQAHCTIRCAKATILTSFFHSEPPANAPKDPRTDFVTRYTAISDALQSVGVKGIAICQWGTPYISPTGGLEGPSAWTPPLSNSYRVSDDIAQGWANVIRIMNQGIHVNSKNLSGPGHWSDLDMMEVGNPGMTVTEQSSHFAIWAMFKSTLMISTSIPAANSDTVTILQNRDLIAINQDEAGLPVTLVQRFTNDRDVYAGDLANGDKAVLLLDHSNSTRTLSLNLSDIGISSATVKNLWTGDINANVTSYSKQVDAHGSLPLRLSNVQLKHTTKANITWIEAESGSVSNGAAPQNCSGCSNTGKVGFLEEGNGSLTLSGIHASKETQDVLFDYINCEIGYAFAGIGPNARLAGISVNGGVVQNVSFPLTGKSHRWEAV